MQHSLPPEALPLKNELEKLLKTLKTNREKVPLAVLKSKYKTGYMKLCQNISKTASNYVKQITLYDIRIHKDYLEEGILLINQTIAESGLLKELSKAAFCRQDISEFTNLSFILRESIQNALIPFYERHTGLYLTPECLENPDIKPEIFCFVNGCIWRNGQWVPFYTLYPPYAVEADIPQNTASAAN